MGGEESYLTLVIQEKATILPTQDDQLGRQFPALFTFIVNIAIVATSATGAGFRIVIVLDDVDEEGSSLTQGVWVAFSPHYLITNLENFSIHAITSLRQRTKNSPSLGEL